MLCENGLQINKHGRTKVLYGFTTAIHMLLTNVPITINIHLQTKILENQK